MSSSWSGRLDSLQAPVYDPRSECTLSPAASAFSAVLSAFVGSVINGLTSGWLVALMTGWIAWLAIFRVLLGGLYMLYQSVTNSWGSKRNEGNNFAGAPAEDSSYLMAGYTGYPGDWALPTQQLGSYVPRRGFLSNVWPPTSDVRGLERSSTGPLSKIPLIRSLTDLNRDVTFLGWFSWIYTALFAPVTQIIFVAANTPRHGIGATKIVKGLTIAITALPLCIDCRVRYADSLKRGGYIFNLITSVSCLFQGALCATLLVQGLADLSADDRTPPIPFIAIPYLFFALIWMFVSFMILPMRDGGRRRAAQTHWAGYIIDVGAGAFAGAFLASPALALYMGAQFDKVVAGDQSTGMSDLGDYLRCESQWWRKFAALAP